MCGLGFGMENMMQKCQFLCESSPQHSTGIILETQKWKATHNYNSDAKSTWPWTSPWKTITLHWSIRHSLGSVCFIRFVPPRKITELIGGRVLFWQSCKRKEAKGGEILHFCHNSRWGEGERPGGTENFPWWTGDLGGQARWGEDRTSWLS